MAPESLSQRKHLGPELDQIIEPGDEVIAEAIGVDGPWLVISTAIGGPLIAGYVAVLVTAGQRAGNIALPILIVVNAFLQVRQPTFCVMATGRLVIVYRVTRFTGRPVRLVLTAPLDTVTASVGRRGLLGWPLRISVPGCPARRIRLAARTRPARPDSSGELITALQAGGARVTGRQLPADPS